MTIQECYKKMGADYEDVLKRLYSEGMIRKFARMFLDDDSYPKLERSLKEENVEEAFRAAHTLKGVCQNLGFTNLYQPTYGLTEVLRAGTLEGSKEWFATVYKGNIIKNLIMDCQSYTKYRPNETTGGIFVSWRRKEELPTGA